MTSLLLIENGGLTHTQPLRPAPAFSKPHSPLRSRTAFAATHVIPKPWAENTPGAPADIDWDATLAFRHHIWSWGLGVADAMDTAQRNMGLVPLATRELITRSAEAARSADGALVVGVNTDHVDDEYISLDAIVDAYVSQLQFAEDVGAGVVLMASRHLARTARSAADYERVYSAVLAHAGAPVILHWLGKAFDPLLATYFGSGDLQTASDTVIRVIEANAEKISGIKMSLLDANAEVALRLRLKATTAMFTGDDFNYVGLIAESESERGDKRQEEPHPTPFGRPEASTRKTYSHALLGAFSAIAPAASAALRALDADDLDSYQRILRPTEELSRQIFAPPTYYYKVGIAFLSWLNGHQQAFSMIGGLHAARSLPHLSEVVRLANATGAFEQPELAAARWAGLLAQNGITA